MAGGNSPAYSMNYIDLLCKILLLALSINAVIRLGTKLIKPITLNLLNGGPIPRLIPVSLLLGRLLSCQLCLSGWVGIIAGFFISQVMLCDLKDTVLIPLVILATIGLADVLRCRD